ncbi:MAG: acetate--CoA ligase family protein [Candidatus Gottesmanbacteria bacterium]
MNAQTFTSIFSPTSIALVGASAKPGSVGNNLMKNLMGNGFKGTIYPVNPTAQKIEGIASVWSLSAIGKPVDLAVIAVKADIVLSIVEEAGKCGVKGLVIISAGFKEAGEDGKKREEKLRLLCEKYDIAMIGPNCLGVINPELGINASFAPITPKAGSIAFISQSGALGTAVIDFARDLDIGFSKFVSVGNKAVVDETALLSYFATDEKTKVILMYVEDIKDAASFVKVARTVTHGLNAKPIIFLKAGRTKAGATASVSHTGALGGNDAYYDAVSFQSGAIRVETIQELFSNALMFVHNPLPKGNRVAVITNAGGPGVLMTDAAVLSGLTMAKLEDKTVALLKEQLPMCANCLNPIDVLGDAKSNRYKSAFDVIANDVNVDSLLILLTPQAGTEIVETAQKIIELKKTIDKPIGVSFVGGPLVAPGMSLLRKANVAAFAYPEDASCALATFTKFSVEKAREIDDTPRTFADIDATAVSDILSRYDNGKKELLPEKQAHEILKAYGFPTLASATVSRRQDIVSVVECFKSPVAMKIVSPDITHKSDVGGIVLHVTPENALTSYDSIMDLVATNAPNAKLDGVLLVEMAPIGGIELILGVDKQPGFGTMLMVGLGGIYVEAFKDVCFGVVPLSHDDAVFMIKRLKVYTILQGIRGKPAMDIDTLAACLERLSQLVVDHREIVELDINPFLLLPQGQGGKVLDVRIAVER